MAFKDTAVKILKKTWPTAVGAVAGAGTAYVVRKYGLEQIVDSINPLPYSTLDGSLLHAVGDKIKDLQTIVTPLYGALGGAVAANWKYVKMMPFVIGKDITGAAKTIGLAALVGVGVYHGADLVGDMLHNLKALNGFEGIKDISDAIYGTELISPEGLKVTAGVGAGAAVIYSALKSKVKKAGDWFSNSYVKTAAVGLGTYVAIPLVHSLMKRAGINNDTINSVVDIAQDPAALGATYMAADAWIKSQWGKYIVKAGAFTGAVLSLGDSLLPNVFGNAKETIGLLTAYVYTQVSNAPKTAKALSHAIPFGLVFKKTVDSDFLGPTIKEETKYIIGGVLGVGAAILGYMGLNTARNNVKDLHKELTKP